MEKFKRDLLESVKQMKRSEAARITKVQLPVTARARAQVGLSQQEFAARVAANHPDILRDAD